MLDMVGLHGSRFFHVAMNHRLHQWNIFLGRHTYHSQLACSPYVMEVHIPGSVTSIIPTKVSKTSLLQ